MRAAVKQAIASDRARARIAASQSAQRKALRQLEHALDRSIRLGAGEVTHGLYWGEVGRGDCRCGAHGRLWVGVRYEYDVAPGVAPWRAVLTSSMCATCTVARQREEIERPIWRPSRQEQERR